MTWGDLWRRFVRVLRVKWWVHFQGGWRYLKEPAAEIAPASPEPRYVSNFGVVRLLPEQFQPVQVPLEPPYTADWQSMLGLLSILAHGNWCLRNASIGPYMPKGWKVRYVVRNTRPRAYEDLTSSSGLVDIIASDVRCSLTNALHAVARSGADRRLHLMAWRHDTLEGGVWQSRVVLAVAEPAEGVLGIPVRAIGAAGPVGYV